MKVFTLDNLTDGIRELRKLDGGLKQKCKELNLRLAEMGTWAAANNFAVAEYDGTKDVVIHPPTIRGLSAYVQASSNDGVTVNMIEFGTGVTYPNTHPEAGRHGMVPRSWSLGPHGMKHLATKDYWYLPGGHGHRSYGNPSGNCMANSRQTVEDNFERVAREVFES